MRGLCRRIELQIANSWTCVPIVRSVWYKQVIEAKAVATGSFQVSLQGNAGLEAGGDESKGLRLGSGDFFLDHICRCCFAVSSLQGAGAHQNDAETV